jgi:subtilisin family serine protease
MKHHQGGVWLVVFVALSLLLPACATQTPEVERKGKARTWSYVDTKIASWWWYKLLELDAIHKRAKGTGKTIAIVDTGVLRAHQDLATILPGIATCGRDPANTLDTNGHGTQLAGIALGKDPGPDFDPRLPVITRGVAPAAGLIPIKIDCGLVSADALVKGVKEAISKKPDIILLALGGYPAGQSDVNASLTDLVGKDGRDILFVVASVWDDDAYPFPGWTRPDSAKGKVDNVIIVAAMTLVNEVEVPYNDRQVGDLWAPGRDVDTADIDTIPNPIDPKGPRLQAPFSMQGTSAASAIVAGCAALVKEKTTYAGAKLKAILVATALTKPEIPSNGRLDCNKAVP